MINTPETLPIPSPQEEGFSVWFHNWLLGIFVDISQKGESKLGIDPIWKKLDLIRKSPTGNIELSSGKHLLQLHRNLYQASQQWGSYLQVEDPERHPYDTLYWDLKYEPQPQKISHFAFDENLEVRCGPITAFSPELMALVVSLVSEVYSTDLLEIDKVVDGESGNDPVKANFLKKMHNAELLLAMCHSFRPDNVLAVVIGTDERGKEYLLGSIGAVHGVGNKFLTSTIGKENAAHVPVSSLPTNQELEYQLTQDGEDMLGGVIEQETAEITRLCTAPEQKLRDLPFDMERVGQVLMSVIHEGIYRHLPNVELEIFNTKRALNVRLKRLRFPVRIIGEAVHPTRAILDSIHAFYFRRILEEERQNTAIPQAMYVREALQVWDNLRHELVNIAQSKGKTPYDS